MGNTASGAVDKATFHEINAGHTTVTTTPEFTLNQIVNAPLGKSQFTYDTTRADALIKNFIEEFASEDEEAAEEGEKVTYVNGTTEQLNPAAASGVQQFLVINYGATITDGGNDFVITTIAIITVNGSSGEHTEEYNKFLRYSLACDTVKPIAATSIPVLAFDATIVDVDAPVVMSTSRKKQVFYLPKAA